MTDSIPELESLARAVESEFPGSVRLSRLPVMDGTGYVLQFTPVNSLAATVTVDYSLGVYTIDAGTVTFDGYDVDRGVDWVLALVRDIARLGLRTERISHFGLPWGREVLLGAVRDAGEQQGRQRTVLESWEPWI